jgi:serpin B
MSWKGTIEYASGDNYKAVRLPYGKGKTAMYVVLPDEDVPMDEFVAGLQPDFWDELTGSLTKTDDVILQIPRFKLEYGIKELKDSLSVLGMGEAFSDEADFSGIRENTYISSVMHKAVIEVNEEGSEAAGVTAVEAKLTSAAEPISFIADRPLIFAIADEDTGTILFLGKLVVM